jgi:hypothetical protein
MPKLIDRLDLILPAFEVWYRQSHGPNEDYYANTITQNYLSTISDSRFIDLFIQSRKDGGHIQSGGGRHLDNFKTMVNENINEFREYVLKPFHDNFDLNN